MARLGFGLRPDRRRPGRSATSRVDAEFATAISTIAELAA